MAIERPLAVRARTSHAPEPDLALLVVTHQEMREDLRRLAACLGAAGARAVPRGRARAISRYAGAVLAAICAWHEAEESMLWPAVAASAGQAVDLCPLADDHQAIAAAAGRVSRALAGFGASRAAFAHLDDTVSELRGMLDDHIADVEQHVFPAIRRYLPVDVYRRCLPPYAASFRYSRLERRAFGASRTIPDPMELGGKMKLAPVESTERQQGAPAAQAVGLSKTYGTGPAQVRALADVNVTFERGQFTAVMGPSGSGKSTLMQCLAGLDRPTSGSSFVGGLEIGRLSEAGLTKLRRDRIGFVFQAFNLVPTLTALENITLPADLAGTKADRQWLDLLISELGIADRLTHRPGQMSGGQQQRVACARALINRPELVFADEPTGNLDSNSSADVLAFLRRSVTEFGQSIVMVTHDPHSAAYADRVIFLADGTVVGELGRPTADSVLERMRILGA